MCGFWIVEQGDERDALVALGSCVCEFWLTAMCGTMRPCVTRVYQSCVGEPVDDMMLCVIVSTETYTLHR